jgi:hypothetical protein
MYLLFWQFSLNHDAGQDNSDMKVTKIANNLSFNNAG